MRWTRRLAVSTGLAVAAVGIAVPLSLSSSAAPASDVPLSSVASAAALDHGKVPHALKADVRKAWRAPDGQRVAALQAVLRKALAGDYGAAAQRRATRLQQRLDAMDPQLRSDLDKAIDLPKAQRRAAMQQIRQRIDAGTYGPGAKRFVHRVRHHRLLG